MYNNEQGKRLREYELDRIPGVGCSRSKVPSVVGGMSIAQKREDKESGVFEGKNRDRISVEWYH